MASRSDPVRPGSGPGPGPGRGILALLLLAVPIVLPLLVWTYARSDPDLGGIPFFFWYQFALIPVSAVCTLIAYRLVVSYANDRRRRLRGDGDVR